MILLPYQTKICSTYTQTFLDKLRKEANKAELSLPFPQVKTPNGVTIKDCYFVTPSPEHEDIPLFTQYIDLGQPGKPRLLIDGRRYFKYEPRSGTYRLVAKNDWSFECVRLSLNISTLVGDETAFSRLGDIPAKVFNRWVSGPLITRYQLPPESMQALYVITAFYYYAMLMPELGEANPDTRAQFAPVVSRITGVPPDFVIDVISEVGPLNNIDDLIHAMSTKSRQERTGELKFKDLYLLLSNSFFAQRENVGVALEHLPTYIAMLYMAIGDRSYNKTVIMQRAEQVARPHELKSFTDLAFGLVAQQYLNYD